MKPLNLFIITLLAATLISCEKKEASAVSDKVQNVILIIGDGMGLTQACTLDDAGNFERADNVCLAKTYSASNKVTDSAAGGTALACGIKTNNGMLGMTPLRIPVPSVMSRLKDERGISTGVVVSCELWHATPAAFYAHCDDRKKSAEITSDLYASTLDVAIGGAGKTVMADSMAARGFEVCGSIDELKDCEGQRVAGLLAPNYLSPAPERGDTMSMAVAEALRLLERNPAGFMLMIEGSQIDWAGHNNEADHLKAEVADLNKIIGECFDYADDNPGTLVIITADHETGGLALLGEDKQVTFTTGSHTGIHVPVYLYGSAADGINGIIENTEVASFIYEVMK